MKREWAMLRKLSMYLVCLALLSGVGCKGSGANRGADLVGATGQGAFQRATQLPAGRGQVTRRDDGTLAVSSPDGAQVILMKQEMVDGTEVGWYRMCDATGSNLRCGDWVRMDSVTPCTQCFAEPCPCTNLACASVCKPL